MGGRRFDEDVVVIGSGFGGSVAALRLAERGLRVLVLERGDWVRRFRFQVDLDYFWIPERHRYGFHDLRRRGRRLVPWLGAAVGGGSHVYAGSLFRREDWDGFPRAVAESGMEQYYRLAEEMLAPMPYPDYPPYSEAGSETVFAEGARMLAERRPDLVEAQGRIPLAISFAARGEDVGTPFRNRFGAAQRTYDPDEQSLLGGDIGAKNTLDLNYLQLAQKKGARIKALCEADRIEPLDGGGFRVEYRVRHKEGDLWQRFGLKWLGREADADWRRVTARRVVMAAGCIGTTELLLRNRDVHGTLPRISDALGSRYSTNGDYISLLLSADGARPDRGPMNVHYVRFRRRDGSPQGAYVESGRYPTPLKLAGAVLLSVLGRWRPEKYPELMGFVSGLGDKPHGLLRWLDRRWPLPMLKMGRDDAYGRIRLNSEGRATIDYDLAANAGYYAWLDGLGREIADAAGARWMKNLAFTRLGFMEIPHNLGGAPMGEDPSEGVVDDLGRVYGHPGLYVLDGSMVPVAIGPNPALTILALAERAIGAVGSEAAGGTAHG